MNSIKLISRSTNKSFIIGIAISVVPICSSAQNMVDNKKIKADNHFSAFVNLGMANQFFSYPGIAEIYSRPGYNWNSGHIPTEEEYGIQEEDLLFSYGVGINYNYHLNNWISFIPQVSYQQKGASERAIGAVSGVIERSCKHIYNNRFHYLSLDFLVKFKIKTWDKFAIYFQTGMRNDILLGHSLEYDLDEFSGNDFRRRLEEEGNLKHTNYPENSGFVGFNNYTLGLANTLGLEFKKGLNIGFEVNPDLGYMTKNDKMKVRNILFSINIGYRIKND